MRCAFVSLIFIDFFEREKGTSPGCYSRQAAMSTDTAFLFLCFLSSASRRRASLPSSTTKPFFVFLVFSPYLIQYAPSEYTYLFFFSVRAHKYLFPFPSMWVENYASDQKIANERNNLQKSKASTHRILTRILGIRCYGRRMCASPLDYQRVSTTERQFFPLHMKKSAKNLSYF